MAETTGNGLSAETGSASDLSGTVKLKQVADNLQEKKEQTVLSSSETNKESVKPTKGLVDEPGDDKIVLSGGSGMMLKSPDQEGEDGK